MIILTPSDFLDFGSSATKFDLIATDCLRSRKSLILDISDDAVRICCEENASVQPNNLLIKASFINDVIPPINDGIGANLLTPLIAPMIKMTLPAQQIYTLRSGNRSIADFFMRNLFYAICRKKDVQFGAAASSFKVPTSHAQLTKRYLWILRSEVKDKMLHEKNLFEMLILNTRLPILAFHSQVLATGADSQRTSILTLGARIHRATTDFNKIRSEVMGLLP